MKSEDISRRSFFETGIGSLSGCSNSFVLDSVQSQRDDKGTFR